MESRKRKAGAGPERGNRRKSRSQEASHAPRAGMGTQEWAGMPGNLEYTLTVKLLLLIQALIYFPSQIHGFSLFPAIPTAWIAPERRRGFSWESQLLIHDDPHPTSIPKFWHCGHLKPICKQLEKPLENMENLFLFLAAAPNCLLPWFSCFSRSDFPLKSIFSRLALPLH